MSVMNRDAEMMRITPLGAGQEVGRSCILLQYKGRNVMLDCGVHPGREGSDSLPFFDNIEEIGSLDLILVTHFHIDHCAALPYFTEKTNFQGRIFMTHATKAVMKLLLSDNIRLNARSARPLYTDKELSACIDKCEVIDFHETREVRGVKFTATAAGHVLGAAMFNLEIDGKRIFYTGDYSMKPDRHLHAAEVPPGQDPPNVMIVESTFGITNLPGREEREQKLVSTVDAVVRRGGSCLIPVFALGRAQELLLILDEYWQSNPDLHHVPVFYASKLAAKALRVYQTFVNMMNDHIRSMMDVANPFKLTHVRNMMRTDFDAMGACVVMASPGFLQNGVSRHLFERWCDDERNGVIIAGYTVEGTLAHELLAQPTEITCQDNVVKKRRCQIDYISFSAHVDFSENMSFIKACMPDNIILVHGEKTGMKRLKDELEREIKRNWSSTRKPPIAMPENGVVTKLRFPRSILAECVGTVGTAVLGQLQEHDQSAASETGDVVVPPASVLVSENFVSKIIAVDELAQHSSCRVGRVKQRILVPIPEGLLSSGSKDSNRTIVSAMVPYLEELFDFISTEESPTEGGGGELELIVCVQGAIALSEAKASGTQVGSIAVEWEASPSADMIADCVIGILLQALSAPSLLRRSMSSDDDTGIRLGLSAAKRKGHTHYAPARQTGRDEENPALKKMRRGDVDPSRAVPEEVVPLLIALDQTQGASKEEALATHKTRLERLRDLLQAVPALKVAKTSVSLSADSLKLIFMQSAESLGKGQAPAEAYCFILFNTAGGGAAGPVKKEGKKGKAKGGGGEALPQHDAVIKCEDETFRQLVLSALRSVSD